jgi:Na+-transporting methylmalonyl-CoA/oxaloacetate decarboxylase beta subunit
MNKESIVHLFHILIVGSLFLYVGIQKTSIPKIMFPILLGLGIIVILYHTFKAYSHIIKGKGYWVNLIHILLVGPLLIYIGYNREKTARLYFELLLMLGFASIGYHGYYLALSLETNTKN